MLDRPGRHLAGKVEAAQIVAQLLLAHALRDAVEMPQRRLVVAQHLHLVLCEVADLQAFVLRNVTGQRLEGTGDGLYQSRFARTVHAKETDSFSGTDGEGQIG